MKKQRRGKRPKVSLAYVNKLFANFSPEIVIEVLKIRSHDTFPISWPDTIWQEQDKNSLIIIDKVPASAKD